MTTKQVHVVRSARRRRTVTIREKNGAFEVLAPAAWSEDQLQPVIARLVTRMENRQARKALSDEDLHQRALALNARYFDGRLQWAGICWVSNQEQRWGSCTPGEGTIRLSHRLASFPAWVLDYVLVHELAHLLVAAHNRRFWAIVNRYELTERARGYLIAKSDDAAEREM